MLKKSIGSYSNSLFFVISCLLFINLHAEPPNLSLLKQEIQLYHDSGAYKKDLDSIITQAQKYILVQAQINKQQGSPQKLAIVLDIDETSLSNYKRIIKHDFAGIKAEIHQDILAADAPAIAPTLKLYQNALKNGIAIFFVTGRPLTELAATRRNLVRAGYNQWQGLFLRPNDYHQASIVPFKAKAREKITKQGYTIIATIGDQFSDLKGGFAEKGFKLPNPFYYLP